MAKSIYISKTRIYQWACACPLLMLTIIFASLFGWAYSSLKYASFVAECHRTMHEDTIFSEGPCTGASFCFRSNSIEYTGNHVSNKCHPVWTDAFGSNRRRRLNPDPTQEFRGHLCNDTPVCYYYAHKDAHGKVIEPPTIPPTENQVCIRFSTPTTCDTDGTWTSIGVCDFNLGESGQMGYCS